MTDGTEYLRAATSPRLRGCPSEPSGAGSPTRSSPPQSSAVHGWWQRQISRPCFPDLTTRSKTPWRQRIISQGIKGHDSPSGKHNPRTCSMYCSIDFPNVTV